MACRRKVQKIKWKLMLSYDLLFEWHAKLFLQNFLRPPRNSRFGLKLTNELMQLHTSSVILRGTRGGSRGPPSWTSTRPRSS